MAKRVSKYTVDMKIEYIPMPPGHEEKWRNGIRLLLQILMDDSLAGNQTTKSRQQTDECVNVDRVCDTDVVRMPAPLEEDAAKAQKTTDTGGKCAWFVGHDGSAHRGSIGSDARL